MSVQWSLQCNNTKLSPTVPHLQYGNADQEVFTDSSDVQANQDAVHAKQDASVIQKLTEQLGTLPTLVSQAVNAKLASAAPAQQQQWLTQSAPQPAANSVMQAEVLRQSAQPQTDAQSPEPRSTPKVAIPIPCLLNSLKSLNIVWSEWKDDSADRPSIRKLLRDHGSAWQAKRYQYNKQVWTRKRKVICAVLAIKHIERCSSQAALAILNRKLQASAQPNGVNRFTESLPLLKNGIHPEGKHVVQDGSLRLVTNDEAHQYRQYVEDVRHRFRLGQNLTAY